MRFLKSQRVCNDTYRQHSVHFHY